MATVVLTYLKSKMGDKGRKDAKKSKKNNLLHEVKTRIDEILQYLKRMLQDINVVVAKKREKHRRETIRQRQEVRKEIRLAGIDIENLTAGYELEVKEKKSKLSPQELTMRKKIVTSIGPNTSASPKIQENDQHFDNIIEQIGTDVQELGMQARMLNEELQQQAIMIDGLGQRIDTRQAHVKSADKKMKDMLMKVGCSPDKCMIDIICHILLLGILAVVYKMVVHK